MRGLSPHFSKWRGSSSPCPPPPFLHLCTCTSYTMVESKVYGYCALSAECGILVFRGQSLRPRNSIIPSGGCNHTPDNHIPVYIPYII